MIKKVRTHRNLLLEIYERARFLVEHLPYRLDDSNISRLMLRLFDRVCLFRLMLLQDDYIPTGKRIVICVPWSGLLRIAAVPP